MTRNLRHIAFWGVAIAGGMCLFVLTFHSAYAQSIGNGVTGQVITWSALITAALALTGMITFWHTRGKAEAEALTKAVEAAAAAERAAKLAAATAVQLTDARIEFARDYATHRDMMASENRTADAINTLRTEVRSDMRVIMDRLDRIKDN